MYVILLITEANQEGILCGSAGEESAFSVGDLGSVPGLGRSPGEVKSNPLQYSGLETSMDSIVHGVTKSQTQLSDFHFQTRKKLSHCTSNPGKNSEWEACVRCTPRTKALTKKKHKNWYQLSLWNDVIYVHDGYSSVEFVTLVRMSLFSFQIFLLLLLYIMLCVSQLETIVVNVQVV